MFPQQQMMAVPGRATKKVGGHDRVVKSARVEDHPAQTDTLLARYYAHRAPEMEEAYRSVGRANDIAHLGVELPRMVEGRDVLEIACGTGYWTRFMAQRARFITAIDINEEMLAQARSKEYPPGRVALLRQDAWSLSRLAGSFNAAVALFWWSHLPRARVGAFLDELNRTLAPGSLVIIVDNLRRDCRCTPPVGRDRDGNSYQRRVLHNGEEYDIIKNYPSRMHLFSDLGRHAVGLRYVAFESLWLLTYCTPPNPWIAPRDSRQDSWW